MSEQNFEEVISKEITGAESGIRKMLLYYVSALQSAGVEDVKQYIASRIGDIIQLSEEQCNFIIDNFENDGKLVKMLDESILLLKNMEKNKKLDLESISIVIQLLEMLKENTKM